MKRMMGSLLFLGGFLGWGWVMGLGCGHHPLAAESVPMEGSVVRYERTHCFGPCPVFRAVFHPDGSAQLEVIRPFPDGPLSKLTPGRYRGLWVLPDRSAVLDIADDLQYAELESEYDNPRVMDVPSVITEIGGHVVRNRFGGPDLGRLYGALDQWLEVVAWEPVVAAQ